MPEFNIENATKEIGNDLKGTFDMIDTARLNIGEKFDLFRFYFTGIDNGYSTSLKNIGLDPKKLKPNIIQFILSILSDYDDGLIDVNESWKRIANILA